MGWFSRKSDEDTETSENETGENLTELFQESVFETFWDAINTPENKELLREWDGKPAYLAFLINTSQFGGLTGKKNEKDANKGRFTQNITAGRIVCYRTQEMLEVGNLCLIPTALSLDTLHETSFVIDQAILYTQALLTEDGAVMIVNDTQGNPIERDFAHIEQAVTYHEVDSLFPSNVHENTDGDGNVVKPEDEAVSHETSVSQAASAPTLTSLPDEDESEYPEDDDGAEGNESGVPVAPVDESEPTSQPVESTSQPEESAEAPSMTIDASQVTDTIMREYYPHDLDLKADLKQFNTLFNAQTFQIPAATYTGYGAEALNSIIQNASTTLTNLHNDHIRILKNKYGAEVNRLAEQVRLAYSLDKADEARSKIYADWMALKERGARAEAQVKEDASKIREKLRLEYEQELKSYVDGAAAAAKASFERSHEGKLADNEARANMQAIQDAQTERLREEATFKEARAKQARDEFETLQTVAFDKLQQEFDALSHDEKERYEALMQSIRHAQDEYQTMLIKQQDIDRDKTTQAVSVEQAKNEYTASLEAIRTQYETLTKQAREQLELERASLVEQAENDKRARDEQIQSLEQHLQAQTDSLSALQATTKQQIEEKTHALNQDVSIWQAQTRKANSTSKLIAIAATSIGIILVVLALLVGYFYASAAWSQVKPHDTYAEESAQTKHDLEALKQSLQATK